MPEAKAEVAVEYYHGLTVSKVLAKYNLSSAQVGLILVNGKAESCDYQLSDYSTVELYPIFGGG